MGKPSRSPHSLISRGSSRQLMPGQRSPAHGLSARPMTSRRSTTRRPSARSSRRTIRQPREETIMNIAGKRVLITGGSSGIGLAMAQALVAKGAKVVVSGRRPQVVAAVVDDFKAKGPIVQGVVADVATATGGEATPTGAMKTMGGLDILVKNARGVRAGRLEKTPETELQAMIDVDLVAPIMLTRAAMPALR